MPRKPKVDPIPDHLKFGYEHNKVAAEVRAEMIAAGRDPADPRFHFDMVAERDRRFYEGKETYAEGCARRNKQWADAHAEKIRFEYKPVSLTPEEIDYLICKLQGVNEPVGLDLRERLEKALPEPKED